MLKRLFLTMSLTLALAGQAGAQQAISVPSEQALATTTAEVATAPVPAAAGCEIKAGTIVDLEIAQALSSTKQKRGDKFAIKLHQPITANGIELIPAGTEGIGEIVHSEAARGGGKPGELLLAARHLNYGNSQLRLRGLKFGAAGKDNSALALGASIALGPFALFIHGRNIEIPLGTVVNAKVSETIMMQPCTSNSEPPLLDSSAPHTSLPTVPTDPTIPTTQE